VIALPIVTESSYEFLGRDQLAMKQTKRKSAAIVVPPAVTAATTSAAEAPLRTPEQKAAATPAARDSTMHVAAEAAAMHNATPDAVGETKLTSDANNQGNLYALTASCTVRDSIALKSALLDLLMKPQPVTIDVRAVERIDTAALQVLCAFTRDRKAAGGEVLWLGCTESFSEAVRLLGLQQVLGVPDALLAEVAA
jgi:anti-anti-sigma regulatory factor